MCRSILGLKPLELSAKDYSGMIFGIAGLYLFCTSPKKFEAKLRVL